jgi:hypothetical protein
MVPVTTDIVLKEKKDYLMPSRDSDRMVPQAEIDKFLGREVAQNQMPRPAFDQRTMSQMTHNYNNLASN